MFFGMVGNNNTTTLPDFFSAPSHYAQTTHRSIGQGQKILPANKKHKGAVI